MIGFSYAICWVIALHSELIKMTFLMHTFSESEEKSARGTVGLALNFLIQLCSVV